MRHESDPPLSIVVTIVSGQIALARCLEGLYRQAQKVGAEIIVPYDCWTTSALDLSNQFPGVRFVEVPVSGRLADPSTLPAKHGLFDLRRSAGLANARGRLIAMTEDHAIPAPDWCRKIILAHEEMTDVAVIGGAIENGVDSALNWAWYYCDFGRYGQPIGTEEVEYVSDVNVSYKREAIMGVRHLWESSFHETTVHWALRRNGQRLRLDGRLVVVQHRFKTSLRPAIAERIEWGKAFALTRARETGKLGRGLLMIGCSLLPFVLFQRAIKNMLRQNRPASQILRVSPILLGFVIAWSAGEATGYFVGRPTDHVSSTNSFETSASIIP